MKTPDANTASERKAKDGHGQGFVPLMRSVETFDLLREDPNAFRVLTLCALRARFTDSRLLGLTRGQAVLGRDEGAEKLGLTPNKVRQALVRLKRAGFITTKSTSEGMVVTLTAPHVYNVGTDHNHQQNHQPITSESPANHQPTTTNEEGKKERREERQKGEQPPTMSVSLVPVGSKPTTASGSERLPFPYDTPADVPEAVWRWMRYELQVTPEYLLRAFHDIRMRKLKWQDKDRYRLSDWPGQLVQAFRDYSAARQTRPGTDDKEASVDFYGDGDRHGDLAWLRKQGIPVRSLSILGEERAAEREHLDDSKQPEIGAQRGPIVDTAP